jgi:hypothetical protein
MKIARVCHRCKVGDPVAALLHICMVDAFPCRRLEMTMAISSNTTFRRRHHPPAQCTCGSRSMIRSPYRRERCGRRSTRRQDRVIFLRVRLDQIINMRHELVQLAGKIDWDFIDGEIAPLYCDSGRPGIATIGLFCSSIFTDYPTKANANAGSVIHTTLDSRGVHGPRRRRLYFDAGEVGFQSRFRKGLADQGWTKGCGLDVRSHSRGLCDPTR